MTVTLIVPVYNVEKYITECLDSLVNQTVPFDEIILVDDGSTDKSYDICEKYAEKYASISLLHQQNQGQGKARNVALGMAKSEYVLFCDADDYLDVRTNQILQDKWNNQDVEVGMFDASCIYEDVLSEERNPYDRSFIIYDDVMTGEEYFLKTFPKLHIVSPCLMVLKREFLECNGIAFPTGVIYEDNVFFLKVILKARKVRYTADKLYRRRCRRDSTMRKPFTSKRMSDRLEVVRQTQSLLLRKIDEETVGMAMYLAYYWNLNKDYMEEYLRQAGTAGDKYWPGIFLDKYLSNKEMAGERQPAGENLSILGIRCRILELFQKMGITEYQSEYLGMRQRYREMVKAKLCSLPLQNPEAVIGIYGTGNHTDRLLSVYEELIGEIKCDTVFLETRVNHQKLYRNKEVYSIGEKIQDVQTVIISSFLYWENMVKNLEEKGRDVKIINLYDENEAREIRWELL